MSITHDADDFTFSDNDSLILDSEHYQDAFMAFCKENFPGADNRHCYMYIRSIIAAEEFAQQMSEGSVVDVAYQRGIDTLFNSSKIN